MTAGGGVECNSHEKMSKCQMWMSKIINIFSKSIPASAPAFPFPKERESETKKERKKDNSWYTERNRKPPRKPKCCPKGLI